MTSTTAPRKGPISGDLLQKLRRRGDGRLPQHMGVEIVDVHYERLHSRLDVRPELIAPNGFLHAATVIALADTTCGYGTWINLPDGVDSFTTIELKSNFLGTTREGSVYCIATPVHRGRTTQVWDGAVFDEGNDRQIAAFRCTNMALAPKA